LVSFLLGEVLLVLLPKKDCMVFCCWLEHSCILPRV
jgi:hypothetical protein